MFNKKDIRDMRLRMMLLCGLWLYGLTLTAQKEEAIQMLHQQSGKASYYSKRATGARTANGERLHHDSLTCAHRSYPFGTLLKVTNVLNGKSVVVRVNDRGPYRKGRIIDLAWGAAKAIGMIAQGIAPVTIERLVEMNIPFKPDEEELPTMEFNVADIELSTTPIWQKKQNDEAD
jgi:rare lipoprotein A